MHQNEWWGWVVASQWCVLQSKPNKEDILLKQLLSQGYEIFYPRYSPAAGNLSRPQAKAFFPGYLFVKLDPEKDKLSHFQWMPNTEGLLHFGSTLAHVPERMLAAIQKRDYPRPTQELRSAESHEAPDSGLSSKSESKLQDLLNKDLSSDERVRVLLQVLEMIQQGSDQ